MSELDKIIHGRLGYVPSDKYVTVELLRDLANATQADIAAAILKSNTDPLHGLPHIDATQLDYMAVQDALTALKDAKKRANTNNKSVRVVEIQAAIRKLERALGKNGDDPHT